MNWLRSVFERYFSWISRFRKIPPQAQPGSPPEPVTVVAFNAGGMDTELRIRGETPPGIVRLAQLLAEHTF